MTWQKADVVDRSSPPVTLRKHNTQKPEIDIA